MKVIIILLKEERKGERSKSESISYKYSLAARTETKTIGSKRTSCKTCKGNYRDIC